jgi:heme/copper-type cytochrome/quinol oxidase subunit 3
LIAQHQEIADAMSTSTAAQPAAPAPAAPPMTTPVPSGRQGMWWFLGSEVATFGGAITVYVLMRLRHTEWALEAAHTLTWAGALNTVVLLTSSLFVVFAHEAAGKDDAKRVVKFLSLTVLMALVFLAIKSYEYAHEIGAGMVPAKSLFWAFYFFLTGLHVLHVIVGIVLITNVILNARKGRNLKRTEPVGLYWHFVDLVWIFLFPLLYLSS